MICSQRGALGKHLWSAWEGVTSFATKWNGFLPRLVVMITGEAIGAAIAETITPYALSSANLALESYLPLYRQIPLIVAAATLPIVVIAGAGKVSNVTLTLFTLSIPLIFTVVSLKDIEKSTSDIAGTIIHYLAGMFASITGGFLALKFTSLKLNHSTEKFSDYRSKMVWHALAGQGFEACIAPAHMIVFKIVRATTRSIFQTVAYNGVDFWRAFKVSVRKEKTYGVIAPMLTKALYGRFQSIKRKELADTIVGAILPFFLKGQTSLFSSTFAEPLVTKKMEELQNQSSSLINTLTRSLIEYTSILHAADIHQATTTLFNLLQTDSSERVIHAATSELIELLDKTITLNSPRTSYTIERVGKAFLWSEKNATDLSELICSQLKDLGIFLMGHPVYPVRHFKAIESIIQVHLKPFVKFTILRTLNLPSANEPLSAIEDIKLTSIVHHILFSTIAEPLLPTSVVYGVKKILDTCLSLTVGTIHKLQGFKPQAQVLAPVHFVENYVVKSPITKVAEVSDYFVVPKPQVEDDSDYVTVDNSDTE